MIFRGQEVGLGEILFDVKNHLGENKSFIGYAKRCSIDDINEILALEREIESTVASPELFQGRDEMQLLGDIERGDDIIAVYNKERTELAGIMIFLHPHDDEDSLALDAGLAPDDIMNTATLAVIAVKDTYRGYGIQRYFMRYATKLAEDCGAKYIAATVSPKNPHSLQNFLNKGYQNMGEKIKYGNKPRFIMLKKLDN